MSLVERKGGGGARKFSKVRTMQFKVANSQIKSDKTRLELDSRADTTVLVKSCFVLHGFYRPLNVTGYDPEDGSKVFRIVTGVLNYDHPHNP